MKTRIRQDKRPSVICLEIVDLLPAEEDRPKVLAEEFDCFQGVVWARPLKGEPEWVVRLRFSGGIGSLVQAVVPHR